MFTKVSVLVPTRKRLDRLQKMLLSYDETVSARFLTMDPPEDWPTALCFSELVFRVDDDDFDTQDLLLATRHKVLVGPRLQGYTSMSSFFNEMLAVSTGDVLMIGNDDMVFRTPQWDRLILESASQYPDGVFDLGVSTFNETHFPFAIVSRITCEALGFLWDPRIFWGDMYLRDVMNAFGRSIMIPHVRIDHEWIGFHPDQTFREANQQDINRRDPTYWSGTHRVCVEEAVEKLKALVAVCQ